MSFAERVYETLRKVPRGKVTTYRDIAHALNCRAYRAVGTALNKNPYAPQVPCHRVVNADGRIGGFAHGTKRKIALLREEGVEIIDEKVDLKRFKFSLL